MRALWGGCPKSEKNEKVRIKKMMKNKKQKIKNKAGYTAKTSRGRVGRGENACFKI